MERIRRLLAATGLGLLVAIVTVPARAQDTALLGGGGGGLQKHPCPAGHLLAGLQARIGHWMDHVEPLCVPLTLEGRWAGGPVAAGAGMGGSGGGNPAQTVCPTDSYVNSLSVVVYADYTIRGHVLKKETEAASYNWKRAYVAGVSVGCTIPRLGQRVGTRSMGRDPGVHREYVRVVEADRNEYAKVGEWIALGGAGCPGYVPASGIHGRSGAYVDALGLTCDAHGPRLPLPPLAVQVRQASHVQAPALEWSAPDQSGNRAIERFVVEQRRVLRGWGTVTTWDSVASVAGPGAARAPRFSWNVSGDRSTERVFRVCSENVGGRACGEPVSVAAVRLETSAAPPGAAGRNPGVLAVAPVATPKILSPTPGSRQAAEIPLTIRFAPPGATGRVETYQVEIQSRNAAGAWTLPTAVLNVPASEAHGAGFRLTRGATFAPGAWRLRAQALQPRKSEWTPWVEFTVASTSAEAAPRPPAAMQKALPRSSPALDGLQKPSPAIPQATPVQPAPRPGMLREAPAR
jgi:hypothetical protein